MDPKLAVLVDSDTPKLNPILAEGIASKHLLQVENYLDSIWKAVAASFPPELKYLGWRRCTPQEELDVFTAKKGNRRTYDVAQSNIFMVRYTFQFQGREINRYISLPFVRRGGIIHLSGSRYCISPVLADRVISFPGPNIFMKLNKAKVTFERMSQHYMCMGINDNGHISEYRETAQVAWSMVYNHPKTGSKMKVKPIIKANTTLVHYLFCKYGFQETFKRFAGCDVVAGFPNEITTEKYPLDQWVICYSAGNKPKGYGWQNWSKPNIRLAIRKDQYTALVKSYVCGFFYIADHFTHRLFREQSRVEDYLEDKRYWMILMGELLFSSNVKVGKLADDVQSHIESLDEYIDEVTKRKFLKIALPIDDVYQLFGIVIQNFDSWLLSAADKVNSMYDKELSVNYYVLDEIVRAINKFYFRIRAASKKSLTLKEVETLLNQTIKPRLIFTIPRTHGEVSTIMIPGDNMCFKLTGMLVPQEKSSKQGGSKDNALINDPSKWLHASVAEVGSYANLPKASPDGRSRINLHCQVSPDGMVMRNPERVELLDSVQEMIKRQ